MSTTGLDVFDRTLHVTNSWLDEIMAELGPDRHLAWHVLSAVLHAVRDRLPPELAVHLGAQLPLLVRGAYYDQWHFISEPDRDRSLEHFLDRVGQGLKNIRPVNRAEAVQVVFRVLNQYLDEGQIAKVWDSLPHEVRALWPLASH
ncbi:DUF2267 domain-containing protein [Microvirga sp. 17 mud 1-3]|uniref:DUF2267 domain-containing protein n=1 Tax=Microvirga sp. 17 mud 1-3 TaxID=2082949 RepID=UPI000D6BA6B6|nr:DUF2267 domain-containing protein [Microvirga sp. 17 mud 1-3]AWM86345.1 DUF2267 domain-containing protein [Microvirga sp. 17 mud 1-3]